VIAEEKDLAATTGFRVDSREGRIGTVVAVLPSARAEADSLLIVRSGLFDRRLSSISFGDVATLLPRERRIVLRDRAASVRLSISSGSRALAGAKRTTRTRTAQRGGLL